MPNREPVAHGSRRDEAHLVDDPDQLVRASFVFRPKTAPPRDTPDGPPPPDATTPPVEDVAVAPDTPSAWDARPPNEKA
jgi:hypothetical protein